MMQFFIGIDVSKDSFHYCIIGKQSEEITHSDLPMTREGFDSFKELLDSYKNSIIALESTGSYHTNLLSFLLTFKEEVCLINPLLIKRFAQGITLRKTKTDVIDAAIIAHFICQNIEHLSYFKLDNFDEITAIARIREDLSKLIAKSKTQLKQHMNIVFPELIGEFNLFTDTILNLLLQFPTTETIRNAKAREINKVLNSIAGRNSTLTVEKLKILAKNSIGKSSFKFETIVQHDVEMLQFLIKKMDKLTRTFIDEINKSNKDDMDIISSIKGISDVTASHFIAEIRSIDRFETKSSLIAFAGTDPSVRQSGTSLHRHGRISKKGSTSLRCYLYLMATGVMIHNDHFRAYYMKKRSQGMQHRKAMIALCNKLLRVIFALLKKRERFVMPSHSL